MAPSRKKSDSRVKTSTAVISVLLALLAGFLAGVYWGVNQTFDAPPGSAANADAEGNIARWIEETAQHPENVSAWIHLGHAYFDVERFEEAIAAYRKALALKPDSADVWTDLGVMYRRNGQPREALEAFDRALSVDPSHQASRFNKGIVLIHDLEERTAGLKSWEKLLAINPLARAPNGQTVDELVTELRRLIEKQQAEAAPTPENPPVSPQK